MDTTIRRATIDDYEAMCPVWDEEDSLHANALPRLFQPLDGPARSRDYIAQQLADENVAIFVAEEEGEIVGVITVAIETSPPYPIFVSRSWASVDDIAVHSTHRRRGIGRALMQAAQDWGRQRGADDMELTVWEFNAGARAFYESLGYRTLRRRMSLPLK